MAVGCVLVALVMLILPAEPRDRVAGAIRANLLGPLAMLQERAVLTGQALSAHDSLRQLNDSIVQRAMRVVALEDENGRLRDLLGLGRALRWGYTPAEALNLRNVGAEHTMLLSAGTQQGVERLSAVVAVDGVVGVIEHVDAQTSVAIIWPHPDFRVSAITPDGGAFGIVTSHEGEGAEEWLLEMHGVPYRSQLRVGTPVVSSGLGGIFPRGVLIGTVLRELRTGSGWARSYLLRPAVRPSDITAVMILAPERGADGVESVWLPQAESLQRRVTAAADSIAAQRARSRADSAAAAAEPTATPDTLPERPR